MQDGDGRRWAGVAAKKVFFGHQSVGRNILDGVRDVALEDPALGVRVVDLPEDGTIRMPAIVHAALGKNQDPRSKVKAFVEVLDRGVGATADIAGMKFCYVDVTAGCDVDAVFEEYRVAVEALRKRYPHLTIVHCTVPVTRVEGTIKSAAKRLLGRPLTDKLDNVARNAFNARLIREFGGKDPVFDLAAAESTTAAGEQRGYRFGGREYLALLPEYTDDGGHLNALGRRVVAARFLDVLAAVAAQPRGGSRLP